MTAVQMRPRELGISKKLTDVREMDANRRDSIRYALAAELNESKGLEV